MLLKLGIILTLLVNIIIIKLFIKDKRYSITILPLFIFIFLILLVSIFNPYGLYDVSIKVYIIMIVSYTAFIIGYTFIYQIRVKKRISKINRKESKEDIFRLKNKIFIVVIIITTIIFGYYAIKFNKLILIYGSEQARIMRFSVGTLFTSTIEATLYNFFASPIVTFYCCMLAYRIIIFKKINFKNILLAANITLYFMIGYGRFVILELFIYCFICYILFKGDNRLIERIKGKISIAIIGMIAAIGGIYVTAKRIGMVEFNLEKFIDTIDLFLKQLIVYFTGPLRALDYGLSNFASDYFYEFGNATIAGLDELIKTPFIFLGYNLNLLSIDLGEKMQQVINIGNQETYNAFYTANINFVIDFGIIGIIIIPIIVGCVFYIVSEWFWNSKNSITVILFLYLNYCIYISILKWQFQSASSWVIIILLYAIYLKRKRLQGKQIKI